MSKTNVSILPEDEIQLTKVNMWRAFKSYLMKRILSGEPLHEEHAYAESQLLQMGALC